MKAKKAFETEFMFGKRGVTLIEYTTLLGTHVGAECSAFVYTKNGRRTYDRVIRTYDDIISWLKCDDLDKSIVRGRHEVYLGDFTRDHWIGSKEFKECCFTDKVGA